MTYTVDYIHNGKKSTALHIGDPASIRSQLVKEGKTVLRIKKNWSLGEKSVRTEEIISAFKGLGNLLKMREPLSKALDRVASSMPKNSSLAPILHQIKLDVEKKGKQLSKAMEPYAGVFGPMAMAMINAGDNSGRLGESLLAAAAHTKKMAGVKATIMKKLAYPFILVTSSIGLTLFQSLFVFPAMAKSQQHGASESMYNKVMVLISKGAPITIALLVVAIFLGIAWFKQDQKAAEKFIFKIPGLREIVFFQSYFVAFGTLADLMDVGVHLPDALKMAAKTTSLVTVKNEFDNANRALVAGKKWAGELKSVNGIERGMLDQALNDRNIAEDFREISNHFYEMYVEKVESIGPKIQTITTIFVAGIVVLTVMTTIVPYFKSFGEISTRGIK